MHDHQEIRASLEQVAREHDAENLRHDVRQLGARLATATVDSDIAADLLEMAARIMRAEEIQLGRDLQDAQSEEDGAAVAAYTIGRAYAYSLGQSRLPRAAEQCRRLHAIYQDPDAFLSWEKQA